MMKLACKDLNPSTECSFVSEGDSKTEVAAKMLAHAKKAHAEDLKGMSDDEIMEMMEMKVHE